ncbi:DNA repair protein RAD5 [Coprinopsis cinerea okayama7|uniref:DNA repair protein RAD5 n=1 Tax=Coprinopsis cinerea (strain Okayama-7 / 130 / ATCC MYA-4618 / FGSC 9003) TaxID=240176 RepID=A8N2C0_COPC7|nr:DNA repair protein RAD5 [Coprinopsis cinerea okayama7\|eukprot:XP_001829080.2 DNA repair protein RAD5 [Coprinopsis cinerea okayama7\
MSAVLQEQRQPFNNVPLSPRPAFTSSNHIDLTADDDDEISDTTTSERDIGRLSKRPRIEQPQQSSNNQSSSAQSRFTPRTGPGAFPSGPSYFGANPPMAHLPAPNQGFNHNEYRPAFAGPSSANHFGLRQQHQSSPNGLPGPSTAPFRPQVQGRQPPPTHIHSRQVIDLTASPSPPPHQVRQSQELQTGGSSCGLPPDLPPKTPVCIGQLTVTALILYPVPYIVPQDHNSDNEYAPVRLQYEHAANKPGGSETIHIRTPTSRTPNGEPTGGEGFGVVEQKVATSLGPMLGKGLIRLDAKIRKGRPNLPILPLQMLVYTPKGNIPVVGNFLQQCGLLLDHPSPTFDIKIISHYHYFNPHNPPPGGHASRGIHRDMRWTTPSNPGKSVEVQRSQVDELFKNLKDGEELAETEASPDVATKLYPHQKKALTFLLERERERCNSDGTYSSLWQKRMHPITRRVSWYHPVTSQEVFEEPRESKGAILADDMGLGKTITCVSLIAATLPSARNFATTPLERPPPLPGRDVEMLDPSHFAGSVWGMPEVNQSASSNKGKASKAQDKMESDYVRICRIKAKSRATLIICPLSTVANWEDQFREHWKGEVTVVGGNGGCPPQSNGHQSCPAEKSEAKPARVREGTPLRVYIYHGNARRPDPAFLADFDAVITTYATLASEFSKQTRSTAVNEDDEEDSSDVGPTEVDERGNAVIKLGKAKKGKKRKKTSVLANVANEVSSPLQSIHWFRVVLDEAQRLCLTGTPVQNKLDDVFALIKFLRLSPLDDKNVWTEHVGTPVKYGHALGIARLQSIMKCITLRRTKESKTADGKKILSLPPRRDELRLLKFDAQEQEIYDRFFTESKAEFNDLSNKNEIMKNYVGILQKILRLRQICDHFELVEGKEPGGQSTEPSLKYEDVVDAITKEGFTAARANAIFSILRDSATTQCVECGGELSPPLDQADCPDAEATPSKPRGRKPKAAQSASSSRGPTRASSPVVPRIVLTKCQHLFCIECYRNSICPGWPSPSSDACRSCSVCQTALSPTDAIEIKCDTLEKKKPQKKEKRQKGVALENFRPSTKVKALISDLIQFSRMNPHSANYDNEIQLTDNQGNHVEADIVKTVVFSQWTTMLDKVEDALEVAGIRYDRLDGTMKREERIKAMDALKFDPGCEVLLVSLKAGGVGLNLTAAQRVYLMDPYWNPAVENQAVDRIHRLGQTRPVQTVKLIIEGSIEARLLEVQKKKTELANMTLGQNVSKSEILARRIEELSQLFNDGLGVYVGCRRAGALTRTCLMPPTPTPLQTPSQIFSLYRTCLREIRQLPHVYLQIKARDDIKRILSCRRPQIHNRRFKQMQKHVLGVAYGRKGKLKWELLEPLADQTSLPTPPPIIPGVEKSRPPVYSPALTALLTSPDARKARRAMRQGAWKASNVLPPRADPESELARLLGPFSKRREVNLQQRFFKKAWSTVHPPLEVQAEAESGYNTFRKPESVTTTPFLMGSTTIP